MRCSFHIQVPIHQQQQRPEQPPPEVTLLLIIIIICAAQSARTRVFKATRTQVSAGQQGSNNNKAEREYQFLNDEKLIFSRLLI